MYKKSGDKVISQHYPALSVNPLDVTGAGDSLLAVMAVGVSQDRDIFTVAAIGCCISNSCGDNGKYTNQKDRT